MNVFYLIFNSFVQIFPFYYADESICAFILCKIRYYIPTVIGEVAGSTLVLACIDRYIITNDHAMFRAFSTSKRAKLLVCFSIIFWSLLSSHIAIMTTIINKQCGTFGIYSPIFSIYTLIFVGLIPSVILGVFGYLTYRNMKQRHARIQPIVQNTLNMNNSIQRRDRDLLIIVITEVFVYVITTALFPLILLEMMASPHIIPTKSIQYSQIENFILTIAFFLLILNSAAPFYIYLIVSKSFRREFKQLIIDFYRQLRRQIMVTNSPRIHVTLAQRNTSV